MSEPLVHLLLHRWPHPQGLSQLLDDFQNLGRAAVSLEVLECLTLHHPIVQNPKDKKQQRKKVYVAVLPCIFEMYLFLIANILKTQHNCVIMSKCMCPVNKHPGSQEVSRIRV